MSGRWFEKCVSHYDESAVEFFHEYFSHSQKKCLIICGAGFDPRSTYLASELLNIEGFDLTVKSIKEQRLDPSEQEVKRADDNLKWLEGNCCNHETFEVNIFAPTDGVVIAGREIIKKIRNISYADYDDVIVDLSALSMGISFPIVKYIYDLTTSDELKTNLHLVSVTNPALDQAISSKPIDMPNSVLGFDLRRLAGAESKVTLWMPVLSSGKENQLKILYRHIEPDDTCPILPFPSLDLKKGDVIAWSLIDAIRADLGGIQVNEWDLDPKNFVYADEKVPLDIYRTILRIADERVPVFKDYGGSRVVLSPLGTKIPKLGILMAAIEREFPVVYVESRGYNIDWDFIDQNHNSTDVRIAHIWLTGDAYLRG